MSESLEPTVRLSETGSRQGTEPKPEQRESCKAPDIDLALRVVGYLQTLPTPQSATASEIAEKFSGPRYTLDEVAAILEVCEEMHKEGILIRGWDGYGYSFRR